MSFSAFWFRRDLRLEDNAGLSQALSKGLPVLSVFIFDQAILDKIHNPYDARVDFIYRQIIRLKRELKEKGSDLIVRYGNVEECWKQIFKEYPIETVYTNRDYESYAIKRDEKIKQLANALNIEFRTYKDQIIFEKDEVCKDDGTPYVVFTAYKNRFLSKLSEGGNQLFNSVYLNEHNCSINNYAKLKSSAIPSLAGMGFQSSDLNLPPMAIDEWIIKTYDINRDFPARSGTSKLGIHLRFGTISIRKLFRLAAQINAVYTSELIWRDFYSMILQSFPHVEFSSFKHAYDKIIWENKENEFKAWCDGQTGYPMVDAGMRELNATGFMHNRLRMITASFLVKHLLIDWRWGEAYFAEKLLDFELASNNGGWQWAAGCGTDAAPYFRIFNPQSQQQRFDPDFEYIQKWVPEYLSKSYPKPIVDHAFARERCLRVFKNALSEK
jgi:deoxyribodipyrimidine photo-lyase